MLETVAGIKYKRPEVFILADNGIGHSEFAARTCYDSFDQSESECIQKLNDAIQNDEWRLSHQKEKMVDIMSVDISSVEDSELLEKLSFVHFHHSVLEHSVITFFIKGTSRGVLQELARHRIASYSVKSTRYTLDQLMYNFIVAKYIYNDVDSKNYFITESLKLDLFVTVDDVYNSIELGTIYDKLNHQSNTIGRDETLSLIIPKPNIEDFINSDSTEEAFEVLGRKKKRNVGDKFKHIITDNFKTDLTMTINLRSLKNFFDLRLSGAAWFQIQWLSQEMKKMTPEKYTKLIFKD
jgi:thymidylate synthase (FAD)